MEPKTCIRYNKIVYQKDDHMVVEILPLDSHVSFYGKAHALFTPFYTALFSYKTPILMYIPATHNKPSKFIRLYNGGYEYERPFWGNHYTDWSDDVSATTLRHIKAFCGMNKKEFLALPFDHWKSLNLIENIAEDCDGWFVK